MDYVKGKRYGAWAGNNRGYPEDVSKCVEEIPVGGRSPLRKQCSRKRGKGNEGLYCGIHAKYHPTRDRATNE